jgi:hypothetical protein
MLPADVIMQSTDGRFRIRKLSETSFHLQRLSDLPPAKQIGFSTSLWATLMIFPLLEDAIEVLAGMEKREKREESTLAKCLQEAQTKAKGLVQLRASQAN